MVVLAVLGAIALASLFVAGASTSWATTESAATRMEATISDKSIEAAGSVPVDEDGEGSQGSLFTISLLVVAAILVLAAFLLADWRSRRRQAATQPRVPRLVVPGSSESPKKLPTFYDDLKRRETDLEGLLDAGSSRSRIRTLETEVADHHAIEDDS